MASKVYDVQEFLTGEGKTQATSATIIGSYLQADLRKNIRSKDPNKYKCPVCEGYGFLLTSGSQKAIKDDLNILADLGGASVDKALEQIGLTTKGEHYAAASIAFKKIPFFKKVNGIKGILSHYRKETKQNLLKPTDYKDDAKLAKEVFTRLESVAKHYAGQCQYCAGNGYLDIGHVSMEGKTSKLLLWVFNEYALKGKKTITYEELYKEFSKYTVEPQWANSPGHDPIGLERFNTIPTVNRYHAYSQNMANAKAKLVAKFKKFYEQGGGKIEERESLTFQALIKFFPFFIRKARKDTGTLKRFLSKEFLQLQRDFGYYQSFKKSDVINVINPKTHKVETEYPLPKFFFRGPTVAERGHMSKNQHSPLYEYAGLYTNTNRPWAKDGELVDSIASKFFTSAQQSFLVYFPMEYM